MLKIKNTIKTHPVYSIFSLFEIILYLIIFILSVHPAVNIHLTKDADFTENAGYVSMPFGAYEVKADYFVSSFDAETLGNIVFDGESAPAFFKSTPADIIAADNDTSTLIWNNNLFGKENVSFRSENFIGEDNFTVESITFTEKISYRIFSLFIILLFFVVLNYCMYYFFIKSVTPCKKKVLAIIALTIFSSMPFIVGYLYDGHDLPFHLNRIIAIAQGIREGNWRIYIQSHMLEDYGYATPIFYPQLFLYLPAVLYSIYVPLDWCYFVYVIAINLTTCLIAWYSFGKIAKDNKITFVVSLLYCLSLYRLTNIYIRAAVGEYTAMTFLPLVLYGFYNAFDKAADSLTFSDALPIIFGLSGIIECHVLSVEIIIPFIVLFLIINIKKIFEKKRFLFLFISAALTLLLNFGVIFILLSGMQMNVDISSSGNSNIQNNGVSFAQLFTVFANATGSSNDNGTNYDMPLSSGIGVTVGCIVMLLIIILKKEVSDSEIKRHLKNGSIGLAFYALAVWMTTRFFPWDAIGMNPLFEKIEHAVSAIQFPWRLSEIATVMGCYVVMEVLIILRETDNSKYYRPACFGLALLVLISTASFYDSYLYITQSTGIVSEYNCDSRNIGMNEYLPSHTDTDILSHFFVYDTEKIEVSDYHYDNGITYMQITNSDVENTVVIPKLYYDGYMAYDSSSGETLGMSPGFNNTITITVPAGYKGVVCVEYKPKLSWIIAEMISAVTLAGIIGVYIVYDIKKRKSRLILS